MNYSQTDNFVQYGLNEYHFRGYHGEQRYLYTDKLSRKVQVLIHGIGADWRFWIPYLEAGMQHKRKKVCDVNFLLVELPGFGKSEFIASDLSLDALRDEILAFCSLKKWNDIEIIGHSMGGFLALHCAVNARADISRVVSFAGAYNTILKVARSPWVSWMRHPIVSMLYRSVRSVSRQRSNSKIISFLLAHPPLSDRLVSPFSTGRLPEGFGAYMIANIQGSPLDKIEKVGIVYDAYDQWSKFSVPVLMVFGGNDRMVPWREGVYAARISDYVVPLILPLSNHLNVVEDADIVWMLVNEV